MRLVREAQASSFRVWGRACGKGTNGKGNQRQVLNTTFKTWYFVFDVQDM